MASRADAVAVAQSMGHAAAVAMGKRLRPH